MSIMMNMKLKKKDHDHDYKSNIPYKKVKVKHENHDHDYDKDHNDDEDNRVSQPDEVHSDVGYVSEQERWDSRHHHDRNHHKHAHQSLFKAKDDEIVDNGGHRVVYGRNKDASHNTRRPE